MKLSNKAYDLWKWIAQILLPAFATLCFSLAEIWGVPYGKELAGTVTAFDTFVGIFLGISSYNYNKPVTKIQNEEENDENL